MSKVSIEESTLSAIGNAIREKTKGTELLSPLDMPAAISSISGGGSEGNLWDCFTLNNVGWGVTSSSKEAKPLPFYTINYDLKEKFPDGCILLSMIYRPTVKSSSYVPTVTPGDFIYLEGRSEVVNSASPSYYQRMLLFYLPLSVLQKDKRVVTPILDFSALTLNMNYFYVTAMVFPNINKITVTEWPYAGGVWDTISDINATTARNSLKIMQQVHPYDTLRAALPGSTTNSVSMCMTQAITVPNTDAITWYGAWNPEDEDKIIIPGVGPYYYGFFNGVKGRQALFINKSSDSVILGQGISSDHSTSTVFLKGEKA